MEDSAEYGIARIHSAGVGDSSPHIAANLVYLKQYLTDLNFHSIFAMLVWGYVWVTVAGNFLC
jgi:hypothetical protein